MRRYRAPTNAKKTERLPHEHSGYNFNILTFEAPRISRPHFERQAKGVLTEASCLRGPVYSHRTQVADLAIKNRLPAIFPQSEYVEHGGLMSYATNYADLYRRAAVYVDKILKAPNLPTFRWNNQRSSSSSSI